MEDTQASASIEGRLLEESSSIQSSKHNLLHCLIDGIAPTRLPNSGYYLIDHLVKYTFHASGT